MTSKATKRPREMTGQDYADRYRGKRTPSLLREAAGRLFDIVAEARRDDLADLIYLVTEQLSQHPDDLRRMRPRLLEILAEDDQLMGISALLEQDQRTKVQAREILLNASRPKRP